MVFATGLGGAGTTLAAAFARTTEAATTVARPLLAGLLGEGSGATLVPLEEVAWRMRATGGGALIEIVRIAWQGPPDGGGIRLRANALVPSVSCSWSDRGAGGAATATFRWNPRH